MTFEELLQKVRALKGRAFPETAVHELPNVISERVQGEILSSGKSLEEIAEIFLEVIEEVNRGSVSKLDMLIDKRLRK